jgi:hypothetical protein
MQTQQVKKMEISEEDEEINIDEVTTIDPSSYDEYKRFEERLKKLREPSIDNELSILNEEIEFLTQDIENQTKTLKKLNDEKTILKNGIKELRRDIKNLDIHIKNESTKLTMKTIEQKQKLEQLEIAQKKLIMKKLHEKKEEKYKGNQALQQQKNAHVTGQCDNLINEKKCTKKVYITNENGYNLCTYVLLIYFITLLFFY